MDQASRTFAKEAAVLLQQLRGGLDDPTHVRLTLGQAKRVRRESATLVRELATLRDGLADAP